MPTSGCLDIDSERRFESCLTTRGVRLRVSGVEAGPRAHSERLELWWDLRLPVLD